MKTFDLSSSFRLKANLLEKIEYLFEEKGLKINWKFKRTMLHLIWGVLNISGLAYVLTVFIGSDWGFLFLIGGLIYCSLYWLITSILFDKLIGDEIDNVLE